MFALLYLILEVLAGFGERAVTGEPANPIKRVLQNLLRCTNAVVELEPWCAWRASNPFFVRILGPRKGKCPFFA